MARKPHNPGHKTLSHTPNRVVNFSNHGTESTSIVQITPYLYLGPRTATRLSTARAAGITHVISVGCRPVPDAADAVALAATAVEGEGRAGGGGGSPWRLTYHRISLRDNEDASLETPMRLISEIIAAIRAGDKEPKILVHCVAGVSRSPALIASYLISSEEERMTLRQALQVLVRARPAIRPNNGFLRQLKDFEVRTWGEGSMEGIDMLPMAVHAKSAILEDNEEG
ncbi:protein-tyrosine phosphatase-like protein [Xylariales sp. PMI_506]|nr:protein-tyrosine phosphatase-like protein [Xylariales sp. PMI_506]